MRSLLPALAVATAIALPTHADDRLNLGYNAVEVAATSNEDVRTRLLTNADLDIGPVQVGYHALNEMDSFSAETYFGRNVLTAGKKDSPIKGVAVIKTTCEGIIDAKLGFRNTHMPGGYGYTDLTFDTESVNTTLFYGIPFGKGSFELVQTAEFGFDKKPHYYTEPQVNFSLGEHFAVFGRAEISPDKPRFLGGLTFVLK